MKKERVYILLKNLELLADEMGLAMRHASLEYVRKGKMTPHMHDVMNRYYFLADEMAKAGL